MRRLPNAFCAALRTRGDIAQRRSRAARLKLCGRHSRHSCNAGIVKTDRQFRPQAMPDAHVPILYANSSGLPVHAALVIQRMTKRRAPPQILPKPVINAAAQGCPAQQLEGGSTMQPHRYSCPDQMPH